MSRFRVQNPARLIQADLRSLALFRIALGVLILFDLGDRMTELSTWHADAGILPRGALIDKWWNVWHFSVHLMSGLAVWQEFLFAVAAVFALMMIFGFKTRIAVWASWFLQVSVQARNPMILQAGDVLFRLLLLWGAFLPLGARWSFDAVFSIRTREFANRYVSAATIALLLQIGFVYWFTVFQKTGKEWVPEGTAVYYALNIDILATRAGIWFRQFSTLMKWASWGTWYAEAIVPCLLFVPFLFTWQFRIFGVLALIGMHASFGLFLELGNFPWIDLVSLAPFVPTEVWDWLEVKGKTWETKTVWRWCERKSAWLRRVVYELALAAWRMLPAPMRDARLEIEPLAITQGLVLFLFWISFLWNLSSLPVPPTDVPAQFRWVGHVFRLDQQWAMFSPYPMKDDGWYVIEGTVRDKKTQYIDVLMQRWGRSNFDKPELGSKVWANQRWRKYIMNIWISSNADHRLYYARWLCRQWNDRRPKSEHLDEFNIYYMRETTTSKGSSAPERIAIWHHFCFK